MAEKQIKEASKNENGTRLTLEKIKITKEVYSKIYKKLPNLNNLKFSNCGLGSITEDIIKLEKLESLSIEEDSLFQLPSNLLQLKYLNQVSFLRNQFSIFPSILWELYLTRINFANNVVNKFDFGQKKVQDTNFPLCKSLEVLDMSNNKLSELPSQFQFLQKMTQLDLSNNSLINFNYVCALCHLTSLNISENLLVTIPPQIGNLVNLVQLLLRKNKISKIPLEIGKLQGLKTLSLAENEIETIPTEVGFLTALQNLYLHKNRISVLPTFLGWNSLGTLRLDGNQLTHLPDTFCNLTALTELHLEENQLISLPSSFNKLSGIRKLFLNGNKLISIPDLQKLTKLSVLSLHKNGITNPDNLRSLQKNIQLFRLTADENSFPANIMKFIIDFGPMAFVQMEDENYEKLKAGVAPKDLPQMVSRIGIRRGSIDGRSMKANSKTSVVKKDRRHTSLVVPYEKLNVPPFQEWKESFEELLDKLEFPQQKKLDLMKQPDEIKYKLLLQYKEVSSLNTESIERKRQKLPKFFVDLLKTKSITVSDLVNLRILITSQTISWIRSFKKEGGVLLLLQFLEALSPKILKKIEDSNCDLLYEILICFRALFKDFMDEILRITDPSIIRIIMAHCENPKLKIRKEIFSLLSKVAQTSEFGYDKVMENIQTYCETKNIESKAKLFVDMLSFELPIISKNNIINDLDERVHFYSTKAAILSMINVMINRCDDLQKRMILRNEFVMLSLITLIQKLRQIDDDLVTDQLDIFTHSMRQDEEELYGLIETKEIELEGSVKLRKFSSVTSFSDFFTVLNSNMSIYDSKAQTKIPFTSSTSIREIFEHSIAKFEISESDAQFYGLWLPSFGDKFSYIFLDLNRNVCDYSFYGEIICELKLLPWKLYVRSPTNQITEMYFSPSLFCAELMAQLVNKYAIKDSEDYGLYFNEHSTGFWLDSTEKLALYELHKCQGILEFKLKPKTIFIHFPEGNITQKFDWDPDLDLPAFIEDVAFRLDLPAERSGEYGLMLEREGNKKEEWLEGSKLKDFNIPTGANLRFCLKPINLIIICPDGTRETICVNASLLVLDIIDEIRTKNYSIPSRCLAYLQDSVTKEETLLDSLQALRAQNIGINSVLVLKEMDSSFLDPDLQVKLWDDLSEENLKFEEEGGKNILVAGTLNRIIQYITSPEDVEEINQKIFLTTYSCYTNSLVFIQKLVERYVVPSHIDEGLKKQIQLKVCQVIKAWKLIATAQDLDFLNDINIIDDGNGILVLETENLERIVRKVEISIYRPRSQRIFPEESKLIQQFTPTSSRKTSSASSTSNSNSSLFDEESKEEVTFLKPGKILNLFSKRSTTTRITLFELHRKEIARQLTRIAFDTYCQIQSSEFLKQAWTKPKTQYISPNIIKMVEMFNKLSNWVTGLIVLENKVRNRATLLVNFIKMAHYFKKINNFHLLTAVLCGINSAAVSRLSWTFKRVPKRYKQRLQELEELMSMQASFKQYRQALTHVVAPCIPYIGVTLQDLSFVDENSDKIGKLINFSKQRMVYCMIYDMLRFQNTPYAFQAVDAEQILIDMDLGISEQELYEESLLREPKNAGRVDIK